MSVGHILCCLCSLSLLYRYVIQRRHGYIHGTSPRPTRLEHSLTSHPDSFQLTPSQSRQLMLIVEFLALGGLLKMISTRVIDILRLTRITANSLRMW